MRIPIHDIVSLYEKMVSEINVAQISVIIFCGLDSDALSSLKILAKLMKSQNIQYKVYPVSTYTELEDRIQDSKCYEKIKLFFFINCGGLIDLTTKWFAKESYIFLFDVHKPIHHANIEAENIKIVDDEHSDLEKAPTAYEAELYFNMDEEEIQKLPEKKPNEDNDDDQDDDDIICPKRKRNQKSEEHAQRIEKIRKYRSLISAKMNNYYESNFYGLPSSYICYTLIKDLQKNNNQYLWYAMVGITGSFLQIKIPREIFETICSRYRSDMSKFNRQEIGVGTVYEKKSIKKKIDFQFPLMRQWSLYESIMNSAYMIAKFNLWEQTGVNKLNEFLNLIGLSLNQSKQLYKYLSKESIEKLENDVLTCAQSPRFNLYDIAFQSFSRQVDYGVQFMASDYYYAISAILERPPNSKLSNTQNLEHRRACFWEAYQLFEAKQSTLQSAIEQFKKLFATITKEARSLIQRNHIMYGQHFSFVNIIDDTEQRHIFEHPFTLIRLSFMLIGMIKEKKKQKYSKPFIAALQNKETSTSLMVGVMVDQKNNFGTKFQRVVDKLNIDVTMNSFTANIMTLPKETLVKVVRELGEN